MGIQAGRIVHHRRPVAMPGSQTCQDPGEDALIAPPLPAVVRGLVRSVLLGCISPAQPIAINEGNSAQHRSIIHAWLAVGFGKKGRRRAVSASLSQKRSDMSPLCFRVPAHALPLKSTGPGPRLFERPAPHSIRLPTSPMSQCGSRNAVSPLAGASSPGSAAGADPRRPQP